MIFNATNLFFEIMFDVIILIAIIYHGLIDHSTLHYCLVFVLFFVFFFFFYFSILLRLTGLILAFAEA